MNLAFLQPKRALRAAAVVGVIGLALSRITTPAPIAVAAPQPSCDLDGQHSGVKHVIYLQFDNVHLTRDNPNVPSDLEQMPNLLHFIENNGVMLSENHTPLIAHTAGDILTAMTGVYPDDHGIAVSNSYRTFSGGTSSSASAFDYWTEPVSSSDPAFNMISAPNTNAPAPWVPYTRAGCNVGGAGLANIELENTTPDVAAVYGASSPEAAEVKSNSGQAYDDFVGIAVHCAKNDALCATANHGVADTLPDEPHGYTGYSALFGHKYIAPLISPSGPLTDLNGNPIKDARTGLTGFPGFDGLTAAVSLGYVAAMQEHGIPVTYAYMADLHDNHAGGAAFGPGEAGYVAALKSYDAAFGTFFARLKQDGITRDNTLFVVTSDEGDHFAGGTPSPATCNGVTTPCTYSQIGEVAVNLTGLLATQQGITTPYAVHSDTAPVFYLNGNPAQTDPITRAFERAAGALHGVDPITGQDTVFANALADQTEMQLLHMVTADPARTPTFTMFAKGDFFLSPGPANCNAPCLSENPAFAWDHGSLEPDINTTWLGLAGPGLRRLGRDDAVWLDHTDIRPTMMSLLGLQDDYLHDGRVLVEVMDNAALPRSARGNRDAYADLGEAYKLINAPVGALSLDSLRISTVALDSASTNDATYTRLEDEIADITRQRDALASRMQTLLDADVNDHEHLGGDSAQDLAAQARQLAAHVHALADAAAP